MLYVKTGHMAGTLKDFYVMFPQLPREDTADREVHTWLLYILSTHLLPGKKQNFVPEFTMCEVNLTATINYSSVYRFYFGVS